MGLFWTNQIDEQGVSHKDIHWGSILFTITALTLTSGLWLGWLAKGAQALGMGSLGGAGVAATGVAGKIASVQSSAVGFLGKGAEKLGITGGTTVAGPTTTPVTPTIPGAPIITPSKVI